jgi:hypothetical protein
MRNIYATAVAHLHPACAAFARRKRRAMFPKRRKKSFADAHAYLILASFKSVTARNAAAS